MKGIYLGSYKAHHPNHDLDYNDIKQIVPHINIIGDMLTVDLSNYDFIIATPPCNYYSKSNLNKPSQYVIDTKHLLPEILHKLIKLNKPFIVENVRSKKIDQMIDEENINCLIYRHGRHTYFSNIYFEIDHIKQVYDFKAKNKRVTKEYGLGWFMTPEGKLTRSAGQYKISSNHQGGENVYNVIEEFIKKVKSDYI